MDWQALKADTLFLMVCWEYTAPLYFVTSQDDERIQGTQVGLGREGPALDSPFSMQHSYVQEYFVPKKRAYLTMDFEGALVEMIVRRRVHQAQSPYPVERYLTNLRRKKAAIK